MNNKVIYWIDDKQNNIKLPTSEGKKRFHTILECQLDNRQIRNKEEYDSVVLEVAKTKPYGVIIDYQLTQVGANGKTLYGTTLAAELRANNLEIPIVGVTTELPRKTPQFRLENYLDVFLRDSLTGIPHRLDELRSLFDGFYSVKTIKHSNGTVTVKSLLDKFKVPFKPDSNDYILLHDLLPRFVQEKWDSETPHALSRWIWNEFMILPGLLIDDLDAATLLGLSPDGFNQFTDQFSPCLYRGIFSVQSRRRWWAGMFLETVEKILHRLVLTSIASERRELLTACNIPIKGEYLSRPFGYEAATDIPADVVAYLDGNRDESKRIQCLVSDSEIATLDKGMPFGFTPRRVFRGI